MLAEAGKKVLLHEHRWNSHSEKKKSLFQNPHKRPEYKKPTGTSQIVLFRPGSFIVW